LGRSNWRANRCKKAEGDNKFAHRVSLGLLNDPWVS
jgi:hypothetical protein